MTNSVYEKFCEYKKSRQASPYADAAEKSVLDSIDNWIRRRNDCLKDFSDFDEYIFSATSKKERVKEALLGFYRSQNFTDTVLSSMVIIDDEARRIAEEIKFLQVPRTMQELADHFGLSKRSIQRDINHLEQGVIIEGSSVSLKIIREGKKRKLQAFMQPVYLNLSKAESIALTEGLNNISRLDPVYGGCLRRIAGKVYAQLTPSLRKELNINEISNDFNEETMDELASDLGFKQQIIMMLNEHREGEIYISANGRLTSIKHCCLDNYNVESGKITLRKHDGTVQVLDAEEIINCIIY